MLFCSHFDEAHGTILRSVMAEEILVDVKVQVLLTHVVIDVDLAPLEESPETLNIIVYGWVLYPLTEATIATIAPLTAPIVAIVASVRGGDAELPPSPSRNKLRWQLMAHPQR